jgi:hypothetical protein
VFPADGIIKNLALRIQEVIGYSRDSRRGTFADEYPCGTSIRARCGYESSGISIVGRPVVPYISSRDSKDAMHRSRRSARSRASGSSFKILEVD